MSTTQNPIISPVNLLLEHKNQALAMSQGEKLKLSLAVDFAESALGYFAQPGPRKPMVRLGPVEKPETAVEKRPVFGERLCKNWGVLRF